MEIVIQTILLPIKFPILLLKVSHKSWPKTPTLYFTNTKQLQILLMVQEWGKSEKKILETFHPATNTEVDEAMTREPHPSLTSSYKANKIRTFSLVYWFDQ